MLTRFILILICYLALSFTLVSCGGSGGSGSDPLNTLEISDIPQEYDVYNIFIYPAGESRDTLVREFITPGELDDPPTVIAGIVLNKSELNGNVLDVSAFVTLPDYAPWRGTSKNTGVWAVLIKKNYKGNVPDINWSTGYIYKYNQPVDFPSTTAIVWSNFEPMGEPIEGPNNPD